MINAYKLMKIKKDGLIYPLFINRTKAIPIGVWLEAECIPTKGFSIRKGWHCCVNPIAPHLKMQLANGEKRIWVEILVSNWEKYVRPQSQGGVWILAQKMIVNRLIL